MYFLKGLLFQRYDSSKVYYLQDPNEFPFQEGFDSIMIGCWWAVVTMSTVGYGDLVPKTGAGKVLGSAVVFLSMIFLALPMTIIVSKFSSCYDDLKYKDDDRLRVVRRGGRGRRGRSQGVTLSQGDFLSHVIL